MTSPEDESGLVHEDLYHQSFTDLSQLQMQLPEEVLVALAREVLDGLARKLAQPSVRDAAITELCDALIGSDAKAAAKLIEARHQQGADVNTLYLEYLAPAAHELGSRWKSDKITFADVTVGTGRIYAIMRSLRRRTTSARNIDSKTAFFASVPEDDHTLGVKMAADLARKDGWNVDFEIDGSHEEILTRIENGGHTLIGLSGGGKHSVPNLTRLVLALRVQQPGAMILISGNIVDVAPDTLRLMHVDGMARDYQSAMSELDRLWNGLQAASH